MQRATALAALALLLPALAAGQATPTPPKRPPIARVVPSPELDAFLATVAAETVAEFGKAGLTAEGLSIVVIDITDPTPVSTFPAGAYRGDASYYPCSVVKLCFLAVYESQKESGRLSDSPELARAVHDMITVSSNDATGLVVDTITGTTSGPEIADPREWERWKEKRNAVNDFFRARGYKDLNANQKTFCEDAYGREQAFREGGKNRNRMTSGRGGADLQGDRPGRDGLAAFTDEMLALLSREITGDKPLEDAELEDARLAGQSLPEGQPPLVEVRRRLRLSPPRRARRPAERRRLHHRRLHQGSEDRSRSHPADLREGRVAFCRPPRRPVTGRLDAVRASCSAGRAGRRSLRATMRIERVLDRERCVQARGRAHPLRPLARAHVPAIQPHPAPGHRHHGFPVQGRRGDRPLARVERLRAVVRGSSTRGAGAALKEHDPPRDGPPRGAPDRRRPGDRRASCSRALRPLARLTGAWFLPITSSSGGGGS